MASHEAQLYVISSNLGLRGSDSTNRIGQPHVLQGISVTRKWAQVGVGLGGGFIMVAALALS
jgi:hypothetical protein